jgi:hypothetical protein
LSGHPISPISAPRWATALAYLDRTPSDAKPKGDLLTPITYFHAAVDSPIHEQIKDVSANESAIGHEATATKCRDLAEQLRERLAGEPPDRLVGALGGRMLTLDDFCDTRLIEVLLHLDDLAVSIGEVGVIIERPEVDAVRGSVRSLRFGVRCVEFDRRSREEVRVGSSPVRRW